MPGAAPAVGVDRRQEPGLSRDDVRLRPGRPRLRQHDAAADAHRRRARRRGHRRDVGRRPDRRPRRAARGRHRPRRRHRQAAARRHRRVRGADEQAARRHREQARGDRHRPPGRRSTPTCRPRSSRPSPGACAARRTTTSCTASGTATARCGRPRARPRSPTGSAGSTSTRRCSTASTTSRASRDEVRARRLHRRRAVRHGRLEPRARGLPPLVAEPQDDAARARLDAPGRRQGGDRRDRPRQDAVRHLLEVGRDDRDAVAVQVLPRAARATARTTSPSRTRARRSPSWAASTASGACSRTTPTSAAATRRCRTSGSCRRR